MEIILFLKPIFDLLWKFKVLDILIMILVFLVTPMYLLKNRYKLNIVDFLFILLIVLFSISLFKNLTSSSFINYIKIISNLYMFFIGRMIINVENKDKILGISFGIVAIINIIYLITDLGFVYWGASKTFRGAYYFKTDLALGILQSIIFIRLLKMNSNKYLNYIINVYIFIISPTMIFLSNSRMYLLLYLIILGLYWNENNENLGKKTYKYNLIFYLKLILTFIILIYLYSILTNTIPWFKENNLLGFDIHSFADLFNESNSQGRNVIWNQIVGIFKSNSIGSKFIGIDLISDLALHNGNYYDSHNNYIKILFTTGYFGITIFFIILYLLIKKMNILKNIRLKYTFLMLITCYLFSGFSFSSIIYTQQSWIVFLYSGILVSQPINRKDCNDCYNNRNFVE